MNKIISVYELLGLIKDGKAPKMIKYKDNNYTFTGYDYRCILTDIEKGFVEYWLIGNYNQDLRHLLNDKVEILEEDKSIIEKIDTTTENTLFIMECFTGIPEKGQDWNFNVLKDKLNEVIDYLNRKEDKNN